MPEDPSAFETKVDDPRMALSIGPLSSKRDGLPLRCVGKWAYDKIFHLYQYFGIFTNDMKSKWSGLNYVEICSGPGRCVFKETAEEVDGTALAILQHNAFDMVGAALFMDNDQNTVDILRKRIDLLELGGKARAEVSDYTDTSGLRALLRSLPAGCLNLVLVDPTDCGIPLAAIRVIRDTLRRADLIITVADKMDAGRNLARAITGPGFAAARDKYSAFLDDNSFFEHPDHLSWRQPDTEQSRRAS